ncbi:hypothetical protein CBL_20862 [Carabus blaptoides fortunei]
MTQGHTGHPTDLQLTHPCSLRQKSAPDSRSSRTQPQAQTRLHRKLAENRPRCKHHNTHPECMPKTPQNPEHLEENRYNPDLGRTPPIRIQAGIKQGCPLSGLIFNLAIDPLLHELQGPDPSLTNVLAYADDVAILARSPENLIASLRTAEAFGKRVGLSFNPRKSKTLHIGHQGRRQTVLCSQFQIEGRHIPYLDSEFDSEEFLGAPVGFNPLPGNKELQKIADLGLRSSPPNWHHGNA